MRRWLRFIASAIRGKVSALSKRITRKGFEQFLVGNLSRLNPAPSLRILNIGSGGTVAQLVERGLAAYLPETRTVIEIDIDPRRGPDIVGDAAFLPLATDGFDCVTCVEVLEHVHLPSACLKEIKRVLKPGGTLLLTTRFIYPLHDRPHDYFRYTKYGLSLLLQSAGFHNCEILEQHNWIQTFSVLMVRTSREGGRLFRVMTWLVVVPLALGVYFLGDLLKAKLDFITSGYFVVAEA